MIATKKFNENVYHIEDGDLIEMGGSTWKVRDNRVWGYPTLTKM